MSLPPLKNMENKMKQNRSLGQKSRYYWLINIMVVNRMNEYRIKDWVLMLNTQKLKLSDQYIAVVEE